jgi:hypothetical protein
MPPRTNPLKLNPLQLRTLTLMQYMTSVQGMAQQGPGPGEATISRFPQAHGDHFHLGQATVRCSDATGLYNEAVWNALSRKGLARAEYPHQLTLTTAGISYDTGIVDEILRRSSH